VYSIHPQIRREAPETILTSAWSRRASLNIALLPFAATIETISCMTTTKDKQANGKYENGFLSFVQESIQLPADEKNNKGNDGTVKIMNRRTLLWCP